MSDGLFQPRREKQYLGDAVYIDYDELGVVLTTEDGYRATNRIVLEPEVVRAFLNSLQRAGIIERWEPV